MRKAHSSQVVICLILVIIILVACNFPGPAAQKYSTTEPESKQLAVESEPKQLTIPTQILLPTQPFTPEPTTISRCDLYPADSLALFLLAIHQEDTNVLVYTEFPDKVIGLEDLYEDGHSWEYSALLGESASLWCKLFEGDVYSGRLYCLLPLPSTYKNTAQPFALYVNDCETPIFSVTNLSLVVENPPPSDSGNKEDVSEPTQNTCGAEPPDYPACNSAHEQWCSCMGGYYTCELNTIYIPVRGYCNID
jgi:hypothetical protein